jgi:molybdate transport system substrate-binding protein
MMKPKQHRLYSLAVLAALALGACGQVPAPGVSPGATQASASSGAPSGTLTVFAAASLTDAFTEMGSAFEAAHPGSTIRFSFSGSQILRTQIEQGAAADVFASANNTEMDALVADKLIRGGTLETFATNRLVVVMPAKNPAGIASLTDLARPGLKLVLAAEEVPAGRYARQILTNLNASLGSDYRDKVLANVVSDEIDVKQVVGKVQLGEADAGIVYVSDAVAVPELGRIEIPADVNVIARYPLAALSESSNPALAKAFIDYVLSPDGQAALKKWGFSPVSP